MTDLRTILVIGSSNTDMVIKTKKFPLPGETLLGGNFFMFPGGKGANQAVAAARLGGRVTLITKTGRDIFGSQTRAGFAQENINTAFVLEDPINPSGVALITVDTKGENTIVVASGANAALQPKDLHDAMDEFTKSGIILLQLEIPLETVEYAASLGTKLGKKVILNPAPATQLPPSLLKNLFLITPNESEAESLTGIRITDEESLKKASEKLKETGVQNIVITVGAAGAFVYNGITARMVPAPTVQAVDTTAAGDVFNGAIAVALAEGHNLESAVAFGNECAAISVTRMGAQSSAPYRNETRLIPATK
jgi:ribokinase